MSDTPTLLLLPGFMCDDDLWADLADGLSAAGSLRYADLSTSTDLNQMAQSLADDNPGPLIPIGFSMGGFVARRIARLCPDRTDGLMLINSSARGDTAERRNRNRVARASQDGRNYKGLSRLALARALHPDLEHNSALIDRLHAMSMRLGKQAFLNQLAICRDDEIHQLAEISCPTLIITGDNDRLRSLAEAEELRDGIPDASLTVLPDCGHMSPVEQPAALLAVMLAWLDDHNLR